MSFFDDLFRKKPEKKQMDSKQLADQARQSGQRLADELDAIFCKNVNGKISAEKVSTYNQIIHTVAENIRNSVTLNVEIKDVDEAILKIVEVLQNSIQAGYDELAAEICENLKLVMTERCKTFGTDEKQRNVQVKNRNNTVLLICNFLQIEFEIKQKEENVENQRIQLNVKVKEAQEVKEQLNALLEKKPWLRKSASEFTIAQLSDPDVQEMDNVKRQLVNLVNLRKTMEQMINDTVSIIIQLSTEVDRCKILLANRNESDIENLTEQMKQSMEMFNTQLTHVDKEIENLDEESKKFEAIMEERRTSQARIDRHIETTNAFDQMMEEEQLKEEEKRKYTVENTENKMLN